MELTERAGTALDEAELWRRHSPRIFRYLWRLTGDRQTAEDLTQETFLQAIRDLRRAPLPVERVEAWLFRIAVHRATDHFAGGAGLRGCRSWPTGTGASRRIGQRPWRSRSWSASPCAGSPRRRPPCC